MAYCEWTNKEIEEYLAKRIPHGFLDVLYDSEKISSKDAVKKAECLEKMLRLLNAEVDIIKAKSNLRGKPDALVLLEQVYVKRLSQ